MTIYNTRKDLDMVVENKLYDTLLKWVEVADSTPSDPELGAVLTYQADDGTLSFDEDFYLSEFEDFEDVEIKDGKIAEDSEECEFILGYDTIAKALMNQILSNQHCDEASVKKFIEYLEN